VELRHLGRGHTDADLLVLLPEEGTIVAGDLVFGADFCPVVHSARGGSVRNSARILEEIEGLAGEYPRLVPGHGDETTPAAAAVHRRYFERLMEEVGRARDAGMTLDEARARVDLPEFRSRWLYEFAHPANVETAWNELGITTRASG
jgi:glyoxylase-like metal-dependent hydrolase (beta-lactamase superfamily II)